MKIVRLFLFLSVLLLGNLYRGLSQTKQSTVKTDSLLEKLLEEHPEYFGDVLRNPDFYKIQVIYTQIDRDEHNNPRFTNYYFRADSTSYFYPASTVKLPVALLSIQKINELRLPGLDKRSTMITEKSSAVETPAYNDPGSPDGRPTVGNY